VSKECPKRRNTFKLQGKAETRLGGGETPLSGSPLSGRLGRSQKGGVVIGGKKRGGKVWGAENRKREKYPAKKKNQPEKRIRKT